MTVNQQAQCNTCARPATDPWTNRRDYEGAPLNEHCADPIHFPHLTDEGAKFLDRNLRSAYSQAATKARGQNTPSARRAAEAKARYDAFTAARAEVAA